jgi:hypothetical protein
VEHTDKMAGPDDELIAVTLRGSSGQTSASTSLPRRAGRLGRAAGGPPGGGVNGSYTEQLDVPAVVE